MKGEKTKTTSGYTLTTYPFVNKGGRATHGVIGLANTPESDCPGGDWLLEDTKWKQKTKKECTKYKTDWIDEQRKKKKGVWVV